MINSGVNKYNVQPVCPYYPEDYITFIFDHTDFNTVIYTPAANKVLIAFGFSIVAQASGGNSNIKLQLRDNANNPINYPIQLYISENNEVFDNGVFTPPFECKYDNKLYFSGSNSVYCNLSLLCIERSFE